MATWLLIGAILVAVAASGQNKPLPTVPGPTGLVSAVAGAPISAQQVDERTRTAPDGTSTTHTLVSRIYRDHAGRMRVEYRQETQNGESMGFAAVFDPDDRSMFVLLVDHKIAAYLQKPDPSSPPAAMAFATLGEPLPPRKWERTTQALGTDVMQGIEVEGMRFVQTSDEQPPITAVTDTWANRKLGLILVEEASGPGWKGTARLENIDRREPDPALFAIPPDYTVRQLE